MIFSYDAYNRLDRPITYLAYPDKRYIGTIKSKDLVTDLCFNNISEAQFTVSKYENKVLTPHYNEIELLKLIEVSYIGWFQITDIETVGDGENESKSITALSLENELTTKLLTSFGSMGTETDENGGLDRYYLCNPLDTAHSILHIVKEKAPSWTIGYIDPAITTQTRSFSNDSVDAYSFLTGDVSKEYECIFQFDTFTKTISAYKLANIGELTNIVLSYRNLVNEINIQTNTDDIKTVMYVAGGDDCGNPLSIIEVNPNGSSTISNFSYYKSWMSQALQDKLTLFETEYNNRITNYTSSVDTLQNLYAQLSNIKNRVPSVEHSTTWSEYGLVELQAEFDYYNQKMSLYLDGQHETERISFCNILYGTGSISEALTLRQNEYNAKSIEINNQKILCESYVLDLETYLGADLYQELTLYAHYTDFVDDTFIVTESMTEDEIMEMKRELLAMAQTELAKVCKPSYTMTVDSMNFANIPQFRQYALQMYLGNLITVDYENDVCVQSRLLKMHIEWDSLDEFELTFSSKNKLDEGWAEFAEVQQQANGAATSQLMNGTGWNIAKEKTSTFDTYMKSSLDLAKQKLIGGTNQTFVADATGTLWRKWVSETNDYSPNQMWGTSNGLFMTQDKWQNCSLAIGEGVYNNTTVYGIWAKMLCGDLVLTKSLHIVNANSSIILNENGATFTDCDITITKGTNVLKLNATDGIKLTNNGVSKFYLDTNGNINFTGILSGATGTFSGTITASSFIGGSVVSDNWDYVNNIGTYINLTEAYSIWGGEDTYSWLSQTSVLKKAFVELKYGYIRLRNDTLDRSIYLTSEGFSTQKDANNASGVIDFFSTLYGDTYRGITIQTNNSPLALRSLQNVIMLNPEIDIAQGNLYCVDVADDTADGRLRYGTGTVVDTSRTFAAGIRFSSDPANPWIAITDGTGAKANLAPILASNIAFPTGGTAGQVLSKVDSTDFNVHWVDMTGGTGTGTGSNTNIYVQDEAPTTAVAKDLWIDTNDYSRYDALHLVSNRTLLESDYEVIFAIGDISLTLHSAYKEGIIKKIYNIGTGIVTIIGAINGINNMNLYPKESVELITNGSEWRW